MTNQQAAKDWHPSLKQALESAGVAKGTTRSEILKEAERLITTDRAKTHGPAESNFAAIAQTWSALEQARGDRPLQALDVGLYMAALKLVRASGNPAHIDSVTDAIGYCSISGEIAHKSCNDV